MAPSTLKAFVAVAGLNAATGKLTLRHKQHVTEVKCKEFLPGFFSGSGKTIHLDEICKGKENVKESGVIEKQPIPGMTENEKEKLVWKMRAARNKAHKTEEEVKLRAEAIEAVLDEVRELAGPVCCKASPVDCC
ncbi:unnamed protein product [Amoebophrya sp. A25]|nr:unnamed protein product [Amoebophrya sp. A25]|eukprot:GSA25T00006856001.1